MRTFLKVFPLIAIMAGFYSVPAFAAEKNDVLVVINLHETSEFKVFNRTLNGDKETCEATNGSLFPLGALGTSQMMLEYTAPDKSVGCQTGMVLLADNARVKTLIESDKNYSAHLLFRQLVSVKDPIFTISSDTKVQMFDADNDKDIDWKVVHLCTINKDNYLTHRNITHGDGDPVTAFFYSRGQGTSTDDSCPENSYVAVTQAQYNQIFGKLNVVEKKIPNQPSARSFQTQSASETSVQSSSVSFESTSSKSIIKEEAADETLPAVDTKRTKKKTNKKK